MEEADQAQYDLVQGVENMQAAACAEVLLPVVEIVSTMLLCVALNMAQEAKSRKIYEKLVFVIVPPMIFWPKPLKTNSGECPDHF